MVQSIGKNNDPLKNHRTPGATGWPFPAVSARKPSPHPETGKDADLGSKNFYVIGLLLRENLQETSVFDGNKLAVR